MCMCTSGGGNAVENKPLLTRRKRLREYPHSKNY